MYHPIFRFGIAIAFIAVSGLSVNSQDSPSPELREYSPKIQDGYEGYDADILEVITEKMLPRYEL